MTDGEYETTREALVRVLRTHFRTDVVGFPVSPCAVARSTDIVFRNELTTTLNKRRKKVWAERRRKARRRNKGGAVKRAWERDGKGERVVQAQRQRDSREDMVRKTNCQSIALRATCSNYYCRWQHVSLNDIQFETEKRGNKRTLGNI